jgi:hypothetical protein
MICEKAAPCPGTALRHLVILKSTIAVSGRVSAAVVAAGILGTASRTVLTLVLIVILIVILAVAAVGVVIVF